MDIKYEIIFTKKAKTDLQYIYQYISKTLQEKEIAKKLIEKIANELIVLEDIPEGFSVINFYNKKKYEYRKMTIKNFIAIYRIDKKNKIIYVVKILYGRKNYLNE